MGIDPRDLTASEKKVYSTLTPAQQDVFLDLSAPVRGLVGAWAPTDACINAQKFAGACTPDPRVTSQAAVRKPTNLRTLSDDQRYRDRVIPYRIKSARKGDLFLSPGGPSGMIGALLSALTPPQDYSHMGIIVEDDGFNGTVVRHCTTAEEWLNSKIFQTGEVFAGTPLEKGIPLHGFRSDAVKFLWPGTITQSIEAAFKSSRAELYRSEVLELDANGDPIRETDENGERQPMLRDRYATVDAPSGPGDNRATGKRFLIHALSFDPKFVDETKNAPAHVADALIVQPCILKETPRVRDALQRVADAALMLRGHYRFYSYTDGRIGGKDDGPPTLETQSAPYCKDGVFTSDPVVSTRGMVCSTFVWEAVQLANRQAAAQRKPRIVLDGKPLRAEPSPPRNDVCEEMRVQHGGRLRQPCLSQDPVLPVDGLYFYDATSRGDAATALQEKLLEKVMKNISGFLDTVAGPPLIGALLGGGSGLLISVMLGTNPVLLSTLLGVSLAYVDAQVQKIRDTATHLSNQIGATFQSDNSSLDNESADWKTNPGNGNTVSPDDTLNGWAAPYFESDDEVVGLYGSSRRVEVLSPTIPEEIPKFSTWEISLDTSHIGVRVHRIISGGAKEFLVGARVHIGCFEKITRLPEAPGGITDYQVCAPVRMGQYYARAGWADPATGFQWMGPRKLVKVPGPGVDLEVLPPKETRRSIRISGTADLLNRHAMDEIPVVGTTAWEKKDVKFDSAWIPMALDLAQVDPNDDPEFQEWLKLNYPVEATGQAEVTYDWKEALEDWGFARARFVCRLQPTGEILVTITGGTQKGMEQDHDAPQWAAPLSHLVPRKISNSAPPFGFEFMVERTGTAYPPARATLRVVVDNNQQGG